MIPSYVLAPGVGSTPWLCLIRPWPVCVSLLRDRLQEQAPEGGCGDYAPPSIYVGPSCALSALQSLLLVLGQTIDVKEEIITRVLVPKGKLRWSGQVRLTNKSRLKWAPNKPQLYQFILDYSFPQT